MYKYQKTHIYMDSNANEQVAFYLTHLKKRKKELDSQSVFHDPARPFLVSGFNTNLNKKIVRQIGSVP